MKTKLLVGFAALQVVALAYMAAEREWVLRTGRTIYLRTAPIDPRDAMRGDYVRLSYQISRVPRTFWRGRLAATNEMLEPLPRDTKVYAALNINEESMAELVWNLFALAIYVALCEIIYKNLFFLGTGTKPQI